MVEIPLTHGKIAIIDDEDIGLMNLGWFAMKPTTGAHARKTWYAVRTIPGGTAYLHREVLGIVDSTVHVDHRNGDGLDCQRQNLREASPSQNGMNRGKPATNSSGFKGVNWHKKSGKWRTTLKNKHLGLFLNPEDAAHAYDEAAIKDCGEFAKLNFPGDTNE
jgi:hypothetical protein